ncbi:hypothetical protein D1007_37933 [Hordeum vulgare]|nr:hypothetical protein D1007_37933 [Hordeum vulgare]
MKEGMRSPPPRRVNEECHLSPPLPHAISAKLRGRLNHYLHGDRSSFSRSALTMMEYADTEQHMSEFTDSDVPSPHITADLDLAYVRHMDRSKTTTEARKRRLQLLDREMTKYGEE